MHVCLYKNLYISVIMKTMCTPPSYHTVDLPNSCTWAHDARLL